MNFGEQIFLCKGEDHFVEHILLHYAKARILWQLVLSLFGIMSLQFFSKNEPSKLAWILHQESGRKHGKLILFVCVCVLEWVRGGFEEVSMSMVDFFLSVWLQVRGGSGFLFPSSCSLPFGILVSILCTLVCPFARWS